MMRRDELYVFQDGSGFLQVAGQLVLPLAL